MRIKRVTALLLSLFMVFSVIQVTYATNGLVDDAKGKAVMVLDYMEFNDAINSAYDTYHPSFGSMPNFGDDKENYAAFAGGGAIVEKKDVSEANLVKDSEFFVGLKLTNLSNVEAAQYGVNNLTVTMKINPTYVEILDTEFVFGFFGTGRI